MFCLGYHGKDPVAEAKVDMFVDCVEDLAIKLTDYWMLEEGEERVRNGREGEGRGVKLRERGGEGEGGGGEER